ncbi:MAG: 3-hydroxyacyl-CoA dehydrogenase NAD-binding domain-containing protein [Geminicoccaceae bacterium]
MGEPLAAATAVGIVGAGTMGAGIAQVALQAGHAVRLLDRAPEVVGKACADIDARLKRLVEKGRLDAEAAKDALERLQPATRTAELADCGLVVEAVIEDLDIKRSLFADLENHVADDAILATNTSSISITAIAGVLRHPERSRRHAFLQSGTGHASGRSGLGTDDGGRSR